MLHLLVGLEHAVQAALLGQELSLISQVGDDLGWWQRGIRRLVAERQDLLPLLIAKPMVHVARTFILAAPTFLIIRELPPPEPQVAQADCNLLH